MCLKPVFSRPLYSLRSAVIKVLIAGLAGSELPGRGCLNGKVSYVCTKVFFFLVAVKFSGAVYGELAC